MRIDHLNAAYGDQIVLKDLSLELDGAVCLFGPSGCGKTTALRAVCERLYGDGLKTAFVFQEDRLLPQKTALENVTITGATSSIAIHLLTELGLAEALHKYPAELSGGMRRRVALARALAYDGNVLLLDEPFKGLDAQAKTAALAVTAAHMPALTLLVTHDKAEADALGCRVLRVRGTPLEVEP